jgi:hypothetical protein
VRRAVSNGCPYRDPAAFPGGLDPRRELLFDASTDCLCSGAYIVGLGEAFVTMDRLLNEGAKGLLHLIRPHVAALAVEDVRFKRCRLYATQFLASAKWLGTL